jgi:hypothetical protein
VQLPAVGQPQQPAARVAGVPDDRVRALENFLGQRLVQLRDRVEQVRADDLADAEATRRLDALHGCAVGSLGRRAGHLEGLLGQAGIARHLVHADEGHGLAGAGHQHALELGAAVFARGQRGPRLAQRRQRVRRAGVALGRGLHEAVHAGGHGVVATACVGPGHLDDGLHAAVGDVGALGSPVALELLEQLAAAVVIGRRRACRARALGQTVDPRRRELGQVERTGHLVAGLAVGGVPAVVAAGLVAARRDDGVAVVALDDLDVAVELGGVALRRDTE